MIVGVFNHTAFFIRKISLATDILLLGNFAEVEMKPWWCDMEWIANRRKEYNHYL